MVPCSAELSTSTEHAGAGGLPTIVLVDGENIDFAIGHLLGRRPEPKDRPRWNAILEHFSADRTPARGVFFFNCSDSLPPYSFISFLGEVGYEAAALRGDGKVVDRGILMTLDALRGQPCEVVLLSHDGDFFEKVEALLESGTAVTLACFPERANVQLCRLVDAGLKLLDLERDIPGSFTQPLKRRAVAVVDLEHFDAPALVSRLLAA